MKFTISKVILWSKKEEFEPRVLPFEMQAVNIITGASRTGKSSLIPIIDYCLGSEKCAIPVDVIRKACSWFGVLFDLEDEQLLLCRPEPGGKTYVSEMFLLRGKEITIPKKLSKNTTLDSVKERLNEIFGISSLDFDTGAGIYRPSYRDFMAFLFQPQNIIANAHVLFYKAHTMEHRKKLIDIFPYVLGAVTPDTLAKRKEIERLTKEVQRYQRDLNEIKNVADGWRQEIAGWLIQAHEYGLTDIVTNTTDFERQVDELRVVAKKRISDASVTSNTVIFKSKEVVALQEEEQKTSRELFVASKRYTQMIELTTSMSEYNKSLQIQQDRLHISTWIQSRMTEKLIVPLFQPSRENAVEDLKLLCNAIEQIEHTTNEMVNIPAAFEREMQIVQEQIKEKSEKLEAIRKNIRVETQKLAVPSEESYTLESISRFLGRLESAIATYDRIGKDSELEKKLSESNARIAKLRSEVDESEITRKLEETLSYLSTEMSKILSGLDVEHPEYPAKLFIPDLSVKVKDVSGRDDFLWEIGSASNWLAYHISLVLALQYFFQKTSTVKVPNFLIFDQPSQVYFPRSHNLDKDEQTLTDDDKTAVKKIFEALSTYVKDAGVAIQIIVTEHADEEIWQDIADNRIHLVERWREDLKSGENKKLVPIEWIK